jgi:hypothetical protein
MHSHAIPVDDQVSCFGVCRWKVLRLGGRTFSLAMVMLLAASLNLGGQLPSVASNKAEIVQNYGKIPLSFEANQGQSDKSVKFLSKGNGYSLFLTDYAAVLSLTKGDIHPPLPASRGNHVAPDVDRKTDVVRMELAGTHGNLQVTGTDQLQGTANYFIGSDPTKWHTNIPTYAKVQYKGVYPGVDLVYYGNQRQLEYDFVVQPGASSKNIQLHFAGAQKLKLDPNGDLQVIARNGMIAFHRPHVYQEVNGRTQQVPARFAVHAKNSVRFVVGSYDHSAPLIIDPVLIYSTYLGGTQSYESGDQAQAIAVDDEGNAYIAGFAGSNDFPTTTGAYQPTKNSTLSRAFISKLNASGSGLIFSTFLGGSGGDGANGIALDSDKNVYVTGSTGSSDFPVTPGAFQGTNNTLNHDHPTAFVTKLDASGGSLAYSSYLGGSFSGGSGDSGAAIAVDTKGNAYVTGVTPSTDFPTTPGAFQTSPPYPLNSVFVTKVNPSGTALIYSTLIFGIGGQEGSAIALDGSDNAYVTGTTSSSGFPTTPGAFQTAIAGSPAFVSKLNPGGTDLVYSTFLGGKYTGAKGNGIAVDASGDAFITGFANESVTGAGDGFPITSGAYLKTASSIFPNAFVTKLNPDGSELL